MGVSYDEAYDAFVTRGTDLSREQFHEWETRQDLADAGVIDFVKGLTHEYLFTIPRNEFDRVVQTTEHPLSDVTPKDATDKAAIDLVANADTPWSFMQVFHDYLQTKKSVPTWQDLRRFITEEVPDRLWSPYQEQLDWNGRDARGRWFVGRGIRWRWGNMYYSALRELDILISLRDGGVPLKYHVLVDALFAVDFWRDDRLMSVYIPNPQYKDDAEGGRKRRPEVTFASSRFTHDNFIIEKRPVHGVYWPVAESTLNDIREFATGIRPSRLVGSRDDPFRL